MRRRSLLQMAALVSFLKSAETGLQRLLVDLRRGNYGLRPMKFVLERYNALLKAGYHVSRSLPRRLV